MTIIEDGILIMTTIFIIYLIFFLMSALCFKRKKCAIKKNASKIPIIIPTANEESIIGLCLRNLLENESANINKIIVVLDNSTDNTPAICKEIAKKNPLVKIIEIKDGHSSKVKAVLQGLKSIKGEYFAVMDADINLKRGAIQMLYAELLRRKTDIHIGIIDPEYDKGLQYKIISWDRLFRQRTLQLAKSNYDMANFPGCFGIMKKEIYMRLVNDEILEDYYLTLAAIRQNIHINVIPEVLAYEKEKDSIIKLFFQRVRWTTGNIALIPEFLITYNRLSLKRRLLLSSYPLLWYFMYYYMTLLLMSSIIMSNKFIACNYITLIIVLFIVLMSSKIKFNDLKASDPITAIVFELIFPLIITAASGYALVNLLFESKKEMMMKKKYFQR